MRKHLLSLCLLLIAAWANAQAPFNGNVATFHFNGTPVNGVKIKTNMPFTNGSQMPTLIFEGYNFGAGSPMGLLLSYYILNDSITRPGVSSFGAYAPPIFMANEGGKVVIFIDSKDYYLRFNLRAFAKGMLEDAANFSGWVLADEAISATATAKMQLPYKEQLAGDIYLPGGIWDKNGNVGIGTAAPAAKLDVSGDINGSLTIASNTGIGAGGFVLGNSARKPRWIIRGLNAETGTGNAGYDLDIIRRDDAGSPMGTAIYIKRSNGNVGIGTATPGDYKLAVAGTIAARRVKVTQETWADFVFHSDYKLPSLGEVENYIKTHQHLPEIPSAAEVEKNGLDLGEINKKLLQKIEELTLYQIQQQKEHEAVLLRLKDLEAEMKQLKDAKK